MGEAHWRLVTPCPPGVTNCVTGHWSAVTARLRPGARLGPGLHSEVPAPARYSHPTHEGHGDTGTRGQGTMWQDSGERGSELTLETGELELHVATASRSRAETRSRPERRAGQSTGTWAGAACGHLWPAVINALGLDVIRQHKREET